MIFTSSVFADLLLLGISAIFLAHVWYMHRRKRWRLFDPLNFFWVGVFVIYVFEFLSASEAYMSWWGAGPVQEALFWVFFGLIAIHLGYYARTGARLARSLPRLPDRLSPNGVLLSSAGFVAAGLLGWKLQIDGAGGLKEWASVPRGGADWESLSGYVTQLSALLSVGVSLLVVHVEVHKRQWWLRFFAWIALAALGLFFLYLGSRSRVILVVLVALMAWSLPRNRSPNAFVLAVIFLCLLVVTNFQEHYRYNFHDFSFNLDQLDWEDVTKRVVPFGGEATNTPKTFSAGSEFNITVAVVRLVPGEIPYAYGVEFLQFFTQPIPRAWWPEKRYPKNESWTPIHLAAGTAGHWVDYVSVPFVGGPSPGHIASWYYNGGAIGLIVGGFLVGVFLRLVRGVQELGRRNESLLFLSFLLLPLGFSSAVGHPFDWLYTAPFVIAPMIVLFYMSSKKRQRRSAAFTRA